MWTTSPPPGPTRPPSHPAPHGHCLRSAARGLRGGLVSRAARSPLRPAPPGLLGSDLPRRRQGRRGSGLAVGGGGGASRPTDHLWKRAAGRGGGRLLVQLQPTRRSRFGGPRLPASARSPPQPPRRLPQQVGRVHGSAPLGSRAHARCTARSRIDPESPVDAGGEWARVPSLSLETSCQPKPGGCGERAPREGGGTKVWD